MRNAGPDEPQPGPKPKSRNIYQFLACFLGVFGIHNFYAGRVAGGVVQLLITIYSHGILSGISGIWAIIEMFTVSRDGRGIPMRGGGMLLAGTLFLVWATLVTCSSVLLILSVKETLVLSCQANLRQLGSDLRKYAMENADSYPAEDGIAGLNLLLENGFGDPANCKCPSTNTEIAADRHLDPASCDYIYLGGGTLRMPPKCPILMEKPETHSRNQVNIVYADGYSEIIRLPETVTTIRELLEYLEENADDPGVKEFLRRKQRLF